MFAANIEYWVIMQVVVDLLLIIFFVAFVRQLRSAKPEQSSFDEESLARVIEPLLKDAEKVARQFETQLREKKHLIGRLNEQLDNRIISLNLLLKRAELCLPSDGNGAGQGKTTHRHVCDVQQEIVVLGEQGLGSQEIAQHMGISEGEVSLVLELKKKFNEMEKN